MASRALETGPQDDDVFARAAAQIEPGSLLEATPECLVVARTNGQIVYANTRVQALTGFTRDDLVGSTIELLVTAEVLTMPDHTRTEAQCRRREGAEIPVEINVGAINAGEPLLVVTLRDLRELHAGREAQFEAEAKYRALVEHIPAVVYLDPVDENDTSIYVSPQIRDLIGIEPEVWLEDPYSWRHHVHPDDIERAWDEYQEAYNGHTPLNHEYRMVHENGQVRWVLEQAFPIDDEHGQPWLIQGVIFDITERKNAEEEVAFLAYHDKLTGLPNRVLFEEMLESAIAACCTSTWTTSRWSTTRSVITPATCCWPSWGTGCARAPGTPTWSPARAATSSCCCWVTSSATRRWGRTRRLRPPKWWPTACARRSPSPSTCTGCRSSRRGRSGSACSRMTRRTPRR
jgi:PAS domain S-box-containing protein